MYVKLEHKASLAHPLNLKRHLLSTLRAPSLALVGSVMKGNIHGCFSLVVASTSGIQFGACRMCWPEGGIMPTLFLAWDHIGSFPSSATLAQWCTSLSSLWNGARIPGHRIVETGRWNDGQSTADSATWQCLASTLSPSQSSLSSLSSAYIVTCFAVV